MTKTVIPSTTLKTQYLQRNLKIGAIYKDPVNNFKYIVEERELNGLISKIAQPYNHKSAGDVRSALKKFTPININTRVLVRKESTFKADATFHLSLTYEDSDPEDDNQIVPKMVSP